MSSINHANANLRKNAPQNNRQEAQPVSSSTQVFIQAFDINEKTPFAYCCYLLNKLNKFKVIVSAFNSNDKINELEIDPMEELKPEFLNAAFKAGEQINMESIKDKDKCIALMVLLACNQTLIPLTLGDELKVDIFNVRFKEINEFLIGKKRPAIDLKIEKLSDLQDILKQIPNWEQIYHKFKVIIFGKQMLSKLIHRIENTSAVRQVIGFVNKEFFGFVDTLVNRNVKITDSALLCKSFEYTRLKFTDNAKVKVTFFDCDTKDMETFDRMQKGMNVKTIEPATDLNYRFILWTKGNTNVNLDVFNSFIRTDDTLLSIMLTDYPSYFDFANKLKAAGFYLNDFTKSAPDKLVESYRKLSASLETVDTSTSNSSTIIPKAEPNQEPNREVKSIDDFTLTPSEEDFFKKIVAELREDLEIHSRSRNANVLLVLELKKSKKITSYQKYQLFVKYLNKIGIICFDALEQFEWQLHQDNDISTSKFVPKTVPMTPTNAKSDSDANNKSDMKKEIKIESNALNFPFSDFIQEAQFNDLLIRVKPLFITWSLQMKSENETNKLLASMLLISDIKKYEEYKHFVQFLNAKGYKFCSSIKDEEWEALKKTKLISADSSQLRESGALTSVNHSKESQNILANSFIQYLETQITSEVSMQKKVENWLELKSRIFDFYSYSEFCKFVTFLKTDRFIDISDFPEQSFIDIDIKLSFQDKTLHLVKVRRRFENYVFEKPHLLFKEYLRKEKNISDFNKLEENQLYDFILYLSNKLLDMSTELDFSLLIKCLTENKIEFLSQPSRASYFKYRGGIKLKEAVEKERQKIRAKQNAVDHAGVGSLKREMKEREVKDHSFETATKPIVVPISRTEDFKSYLEQLVNCDVITINEIIENLLDYNANILKFENYDDFIKSIASINPNYKDVITIEKFMEIDIKHLVENYFSITNLNLFAKLKGYLDNYPHLVFFEYLKIIKAINKTNNYEQYQIYDFIIKINSIGLYYSNEEQFDLLLASIISSNVQFSGEPKWGKFLIYESCNFSSLPKDTLDDNMEIQGQKSSDSAKLDKLQGKFNQIFPKFWGTIQKKSVAEVDTQAFKDWLLTGINEFENIAECNLFISFLHKMGYLKIQKLSKPEYDVLSNIFEIMKNMKIERIQ